MDDKPLKTLQKMALSARLREYWAKQPRGSIDHYGANAGLFVPRINASKFSEYNGPIPESVTKYIEAHEAMMKVESSIQVDIGSSQDKNEGIPPKLIKKLSSAMGAQRFAEIQLKSDRKITPELFLILTDVDVRDLPKPTVKANEPTISAATFKKRLDGVMIKPVVKQPPSLDELLGLKPKVPPGAADAP